jgi:hypothetical protein
VKAFGLVLGTLVGIALLVIAIAVGDFTQPGFNLRRMRKTSDLLDWELLGRIPNRVFVVLIALGFLAWMLLRYG